MFPSEIVIAETKPETEWVRGRALQKVSPTYWHGFAQSRVATALSAWAEATSSGRVATEWRFRVTPPGEITRPLVPDVAYVSYERLPRNAKRDEIGVPQLAPTLAVEITSPDDRRDDVIDKIDVYLRAGTKVILIVDPLRYRATAYDEIGSRDFTRADTFSHSALPNFKLLIGTLFEDVWPADLND